MQIFDQKFSSNKMRYILQCFLATLSVFVILLILDAMTNAIIIAALGSSTFIVFAMPEAQVSRPRFLIGGYIIGISMGLLCHYLSLLPLLAQLSIIQEFPHVLFGALCVGLTIFAMVITDTEHPPAAGAALALIINEWSYMTIVVAMVGVVSLCIIRYLFKSALRNLL